MIATYGDFVVNTRGLQAVVAADERNGAVAVPVLALVYCDDARITLHCGTHETLVALRDVLAKAMQIDNDDADDLDDFGATW